jgi:outer membrane protein OmpA-like peptidoglycan-associated protein
MSYLSTNHKVSWLALSLACSPLLGCATAQPPQELLDARAAYTKAQGGYARELSPASLHTAKQALDGAEKKFEDDGASDEVRDQAYIALRRAQLAEADGTTAHFQRELAANKQRAQEQQAKTVQSTQAELAQTKEQLAKEQSARQAAEQRAQDALDRLQANANVKKESRGTVITLSGGVLFASGKSMLLPGAQTSLNQVADALKDQSNSKILVEGHTDSTGSMELNMELSRQRAEAVASYLTSKGVPRDLVTAQGLGPSRPVADNATPEGRANNRRVEIVVQPQEQR